MNDTSLQLTAIQKRLNEGDRLSDQDVALLVEIRRSMNEGNRFVDAAVEKLALREGEELWDFVMAVSSAVATDRVLLADGSLDVWLEGVYDDFVVVQDMGSGRFFKATFTRDESGEFTFAEPVEVRPTFVEVEGESVERRINVGKSKKVGTWGGVLPNRLGR